MVTGKQVFADAVDALQLTKAERNLSEGAMQKLNMYSREARQMITPLIQLRTGRHRYTFSFGDGEKVCDILRARYDIRNAQPRDLPHVLVRYLGGNLESPFERSSALLS